MSQELDEKFLERLANVYTLTMSIPNDNRFAMEDWARGNPESECGTTACMVGHAGLHPWFRERGLKFATLKQWLNGVAILFNNSPFHWLEGFFGFRGGGDDHPFFNFGAESPEDAATGVKHYMMIHWGLSVTEQAIAAATATYDIDEVHKNSPWSCS